MKPAPINVYFDTSTLGDANSHRGIGTYTRFLTQELSLIPDLNIMTQAETATKPDIVHYPYFDFFFSSLPLLQFTPTVVTIHDVIPLIFPEQYPVGVKGSARFFKQKLALSRVKAIITDSECSKKDIIEHLHVKPDLIKVIYLAANPEIQPQTQESIKRVSRKYQLPSHYILYVGDINYNKNIPQLIKAVKYLPYPIKLVCVGRNFVPAEITEWQAITTQIALSDVEKRIQFIPTLLSQDAGDLAAIYSGALCYVQPSLYEGFGLPILEAMQAETPVVCTVNSSLPEVGGKEVFYAQSDAQSLSEQILKVLELKSRERSKLLQSAYAWSQKFTWQQTAKQTASVYRQLLQTKT